MNPVLDYPDHPLAVLLFALRLDRDGQQQIGRSLKACARFPETAGPATEPRGEDLGAGDELLRDDRPALARRLRRLAKVQFDQAIAVATDLERPRTCPSCHTEALPGARFCTECGKPVAALAQADP